ncbi:hypothetical protein QBC44DRAFT_373832 [Cladorrhinum sp. PSN332]|nr:hypothetical protein QBC44DRAFT_373832 [Cladorrhinum sp. PSN332]
MPPKVPPPGPPGDPRIRDGGNEAVLRARDLLMVQQAMSLPANRKNQPNSPYWKLFDEAYTVDWYDTTNARQKANYVKIDTEAHKTLCLTVPLGVDASEPSASEKLGKAWQEAFMSTKEESGMHPIPTAIIKNEAISQENMTCINALAGLDIASVVIMNSAAFKGLDVLHGVAVRWKIIGVTEREKGQEIRNEKSQNDRALLATRQNLLKARGEKAQLEKERLQLLTKHAAELGGLKTAHDEKVAELQKKIDDREQEDKEKEEEKNNPPEPPTDSPANKWTDVRMRALHSITAQRDEFSSLAGTLQDLKNAGQAILASPATAYARAGSSRFTERFNIINALIHGGDLKNDCQIIVNKSIEKRHDAKRSAYFRLAFKHAYGRIDPSRAQDILNALKHATDQVREFAESHRRFIDKYLAVRDFTYTRIASKHGSAPDRKVAARPVTRTNTHFQLYVRHFATVCQKINQGEGLRNKTAKQLNNQRYKIFEEIRDKWTTATCNAANWPPPAPTPWEFFTNLASEQQCNSDWNKPEIANYLAETPTK